MSENVRQGVPSGGGLKAERGRRVIEVSGLIKNHGRQRVKQPYITSARG